MYHSTRMEVRRQPLPVASGLAFDYVGLRDWIWFDRFGTKCQSTRASSLLPYNFNLGPLLKQIDVHASLCIFEFLTQVSFNKFFKTYL